MRTTVMIRTTVWMRTRERMKKIMRKTDESLIRARIR